MKKLLDLELSLSALESYDPLAFEEEIDQILLCIEADLAYEDAPELTTEQLSIVVENLCCRTKMIDGVHSPNLHDALFDEGDFRRVRDNIRKILINKYHRTFFDRM